MARHPETCQTCTRITKNEAGQYETTTEPDNKCEIRSTCPDDGSTTTKRTLELYEVKVDLESDIATLIPHK